MKVTQHGQNLWKLTRLWGFNCFLVKEDDGLTLVDAGLGGSAADIQKAAEQIGLPITRITLTHAHSDHIGSLDDVARHTQGAEMAWSERTATFLRGEMALLPGEPQAELRGGFERRDSVASRLLKPGDMLGSLRVVATPGHSPDHVALLDVRDKTLIAGDAFQTMAGIAVAGIRRWLFPFPAMATWHRPTALQSALALRELEPSRLAVGHGAVLEQPAHKMDEAIREAEEAVHGR